MKKSFFFAGALVWAGIAVVALGVLGYGLFNRNRTGSWFGGLFSGGQTWDNTELVKEESFSLAGIGELAFDVSHHSLDITLVEGDTLTVRQFDIDDENLFAALSQGGRLAVSIPPRSRFFVGVSIAFPRLEISLPAAYASAVTLGTSSGSVTVPAAPRWGNTRIGTSSGTVRLEEGIACAALYIETASGSVHAGGISADAAVEVSTSSGTQRLDIIHAGGDIALTSNSGTINAADVTAGGAVRVGSSSGTQRLESVTAPGDITLKSSSASINCGGIAAANCTITTSSGTLDLGDIAVGGHLEIDTSSASHNTGNVSAGTYRISSTSGTLRYGGLSGRGSVKTSSASVNIDALDIKGDTEITSTSGTQRLTLAGAQSFRVDISTNSGGINADGIDLNYTDRDGDNAFGTVGDGSGGTLTLKTSSGSINID